ncbi:nitrate- and nitrite sensing domain-containing protein [Streptomyces sp. M92]|nr:nitrate- and nitrite sensing domain-containing protein [Streptomyces sp. M92]WCN03451.1 nitrate- and nitrite sensing domain-containing protein [Streptomyces sp. M92]
MQGRFKRDGSASAEPEPQHGGTGPKAVSSSPQHAQNPGQDRPSDSGDGAGRQGSADSASGQQPPAKPAKGSTGPGPRIALRNWRISTRLVSLLALPVVAATSLGAMRISQSVEDIQQLDNMKLLTEMTKQATELAHALQEERDQSAGPLAHDSSSGAIAVKGDREKTDRARKNFLDSSEAIDAASKDGNLVGVRDSLVGLAGDLNDLERIRSTAYQAEDNSTQTVEAYHRLITHLLDLSQDMAEATSNPEMIQRTRTLAAFSSAKEYASIQRAVLAAALPASNTGKPDLAENDRLYAESALQSQKSEIRSFTSIYGDGAEELLKPISEGNPVIESSDAYAGRALAKEGALGGLDKRSYQDWLDDSSTKIQQMKNIELKLLEDMEQQARELRSESEREAIISGVVILLVLGVSLVGAFVVARSMIRSLRRLEDTATKVAQDRLPELVKQLSETDPQDVDTSVESVGVHSRDEIGRVAAAFDDVHREAVRLAAEQALLRGNVNAMFTNLSRRSQGLIQRQLSLISELESREADPDQLSSLFKLDHLATRMRRNGENLLVLAGEEPGRRWTRPVPLVDVLRAAASEVEQYERIELASVPTTEVAGRVVNDLVHLLAELLENATSFSSPQTKVKVTGHALPDGRVLIEIHDTGIGLSPEDLAAINERLASPPTVDVSVSRRMGLFVVGRLSQRHGIRIQLRPSDSGGTTALVMLPVDVAQGGRKPQPKPGQGAGNGGPAAAQAAAGVAAARRGGGQGGGALGGGGGFGGGGGALGAGRRAVAGSPPVRDRGPHTARAGRGRAPGCAGRRARTPVPRGPGSAEPAGPGRRGRRCRTGPRCSAGPAGRGHERAAGQRAPRQRSARQRSAGPGHVRWRTRSLRARAAREAPGSAGGGGGARCEQPSRAVGRSCRRAADRGPSCPAATRSHARPAGATRTRSRPCRAPRWTSRAATRSRTAPVPTALRATTTGRARARPRRCRRSPLSARPRAPAPRPSSPVRTSTPRHRARRTRRAPDSSPSRVRTSTVRSSTVTTRSVRTSTARTPSRATGSRGPSRPPRSRTAPSSARTSSADSPARGTTTARPASTICRGTRTRPTPARSSARRGPARTAATTSPRRGPPYRSSVPPPRSPRSGPPRSGRKTPGRCPRPPARVTDVRRCSTRWRPTGSTATARGGPSRARRPRRRSRRRPSPRPRRPLSGPPPPPGGARRTTTSSGRPSVSGSPLRAGSPPPACRAGSPGPTSSRARPSSSRTRTVRRSRVRPTTCAAG